MRQERLPGLPQERARRQVPVRRVRKVWGGAVRAVCPEAERNGSAGRKQTRIFTKMVLKVQQNVRKIRFLRLNRPFGRKVGRILKCF